MDQLLQRVDINKIAQRIDIDGLVAQTDLGAIIRAEGAVWPQPPSTRSAAKAGGAQQALLSGLGAAA